MIRGEKEKQSLKNIRVMVNNNQVEYVNLPDQTIEIIKKIVSNVESNKKTNDFPDFIYEDSYIEHFQVSSAKKNKKGSEYNIQKSKFQHDCHNRNEELNNLINKMEPMNMRCVEYEMDNPEYSYDYYIGSFKRNFVKHINHIKGTHYECKCGIFLIEYVGPNIFRKINNDCQIIYHKLSMDREILSFLEENRKIIKYVIYKENNRCEILCLENIDKIIEKVPNNLEYKMGRYRNIQQCILINI